MVDQNPELPRREALAFEAKVDKTHPERSIAAAYVSKYTSEPSTGRHLRRAFLRRDADVPACEQAVDIIRQG